MTLWLIEPRDPLIVREGRPFGPDAGTSATSLPFPFPSTIAGGARTRSALDENGVFKYEPNDKDHLDQLKKIRIRGPLLVQLAKESNEIASEQDAWLVPMPNDAQLFATETKGEVLLRRLVPLTPPAGAQSDFDRKGRELQLQFVGQERVNSQPRKPLSHQLRYWYWHQFQIWLTDPVQLENKEALPLAALGREDLIREYRSHVSMDSDKEMGKEGLLFGTSGLEFTHPGQGKERLHKAQRLALAIDVEGGNMAPGVAGLGGERRFVTWRQSHEHFPVCPDNIKQMIKHDKHCRIVLLTPASFKLGYYPTWLHTTHAQQYGVKVEIKGIAVRRPQVVSGWDFAIGRPKPSRRLAPAGTVFFLSVQGSNAALDAWIGQTWMQCISDDDQDRCDSFGLAVLGTWSGKPVAMQ